MHCRSFNYAKYVMLAQEQHIVEMLEVSAYHWAIIGGLIVGNYLRTEFVAVNHSLLDNWIEKRYCSHIQNHHELHVRR
jgi:hypothetical protein